MFYFYIDYSILWNVLSFGGSCPQSRKLTSLNISVLLILRTNNENYSMSHFCFRFFNFWKNLIDFDWLATRNKASQWLAHGHLSTMEKTEAKMGHDVNFYFQKYQRLVSLDLLFCVRVVWPIKALDITKFPIKPPKIQENTTIALKGFWELTHSFICLFLTFVNNENRW